MAKVDFTQAKLILARLQTPTIEDRIKCLKDLITWAEGNIPFHRAKFDEVAEKKFQRATRARQLAMGTGSTPEEHETALRTVSRLFFEAMAPLGAPSIEEHYAILARDMPKLIAKAQAEWAAKQQKLSILETKYASFLAVIRAMYKGFGLNYEVSDTLTQPTEFDPATKVFTFSESCVVDLMNSKKSLGEVALSQLTRLSRAAIAQQDSAGNVTFDFRSLWAKLETLAPQVGLMLNGVPIQVQMVAAPQIQVAGSPVAPRAPRAPRMAQPKGPTFTAPSTSNLSPLNPYRGMKGAMFERLLEKVTGKLHIGDITDGLNPKDPSRLLSHIAVEGKANGLWSVSRQGRGWIVFDLTLLTLKKGVK